MSCRLRELTRDDLEMVMRWRMLPEITRHMYSDPVLTMEKQLAWFERVSDSPQTKVWIIELLPDRVPVGVVSLGEIDLAHKHCNWAYYIGDPAAMGKGLAKPIECNVYDHVFETLGLNKLWCEVLSSNSRVVSLHERFGSKVEGVLRQHILKNGEYLDVVRMAILKTEWLEFRKTLNYSKISID